MLNVQEIEFKKRAIESYQEVIFNKKVEQSIDMRIALDPQIDGAVVEIDQQIKDLKPKTELPTGKKTTKAEKLAINKAKLDLQGLEFKRSRLLIKKSDLHKTIAERAREINGFVEMIKAYEEFTGEVRELLYLEIDGTRYKAKGNRKELDEKGTPILYMENVKNNPAKTSKEA